MAFNLGVNEKIGNIPLDLKKIKEPLEIKLINDMPGQVTIHRKKNSLTVTAYATKSTTKESGNKVLYYYESFVHFPSDDYCIRYVTCLEYTKIYETYDWYWYSPGSVVGQELDLSEMKKDNITFEVYDENGNLVTSENHVLITPGIGTDKKAEELFEQYRGKYEAYKAEVGTAVVDYTRVLGKFTITNVNYYTKNMNDIYLTLGSTYSTYNLITATYDVYGDKKNKFDGTNFNEKFDGTDYADKIYTSGGNDIIEGNKGNDKIYISGKGIKTVNINKGDENDIIYNAKNADYTDIYFDTDNLYYEKKSNNLVVYRRYGDGLTESTTISNFFNKKPYVYVNTPSENTDVTVMSKLNSNEIQLLLYGNGKTLTGSAFSDQIVAGDNTKTVKAKDGDNLIITSGNNKYAMTLYAGKNDDVYNINNLDKKITISDNGGSDIIMITDDNYSKDDLFVFYDIKLGKDGSIETEKNMHLLSVDNNTGYAIKSRKGKLSENIVIKNCMTKNGASSNGWIENISVSGDYFTPDWASLEHDVASWLADSKYTSVSAAMKKASIDDIQSLMQIYAKYS